MLIKESVKLEINVAAGMRDGVTLYADVYRPDDSEKHPAVLVRSPYNKSDTTGNVLSGYMSPYKFARAGYAMVIQDLRGTGVSEGEFYPRRAEANDGYDSVEWLAAQPWCDGNVGTCGLSHLGFTQWAAAKAQPPHLKTICPAGTQAGARPFKNGAFRLNQMLVWYMSLTALALRRSKLPARLLKPRLVAMAKMMDNIFDQLSFLPLKNAPFLKLASEPDLLPFYTDYLSNIEDKSYWRTLHTPTLPEEVVIPALHVAGWYDDLSSDVLDSYVNMKKKGGSALARKNQKIIMGPWIHTTEQASTSGDLDFGAAASGNAVGTNNLHIRWFDRWLKGVNNGIDTEPPVKIFIMGANVWREEKDWPLPDTQYIKYYLHSGGRANARFGNGEINDAPPGDELPDMYLYDPRNPTPTKSGKFSAHFLQGAFEQQEIEERNDVLVYTSPVLKEDVEVTGPVQLELWASSSEIDTDFTGKLVDVHPDGKSYNLIDSVMRARYRNSDFEADFIRPGKIYQYSFSLGGTANVFKSGHRIRVQISSSNFPKWDRNLNTGHPIGQDANLSAAVQTVYHDKKHPSCIVLPVIHRR